MSDSSELSPEQSERAAAAAEVVRRYWDDVWLQRDLSVLGDLYTEPTVRHTSSGSRTMTLADLERQLGDALNALRGESFKIDALTIVDDVAWVRLTLHGVSMATMAPMIFTWMAQYRLEGNKIAETWALHQSGLDWHL